MCKINCIRFKKIFRSSSCGILSSLEKSETNQLNYPHLHFLRSLILPVTTVLDKKRPVFQVFLAGVDRIKFVQLTENNSPDSMKPIGFINKTPWILEYCFTMFWSLLLCTLFWESVLRYDVIELRKPSVHTIWLRPKKRRYLLAIRHGHISKVLSPLTVDWIFESLFSVIMISSNDNIKYSVLFQAAQVLVVFTGWSASKFGNAPRKPNHIVEFIFILTIWNLLWKSWIACK